MSINLTQQAVDEFASDVVLLLQKRGSMLRRWIYEKPARGEFISPQDQIGAINTIRPTNRFGPMPRVDATFARRWATPVDIEVPQLIDPRDLLRNQNDPTMEYQRNAAYAVGRDIDQIIFDNYYAAAIAGKRHDTTVAFAAGQIVAVGFGGTGNLGLNPAKVKEAKRLAIAANVDLATDPLIMPITSTQWSNLLDHPEVTSGDFYGNVLADGYVGQWLGVKFVPCEGLPKSGSNRQVPCHARTGMHLAKWQDVTVNIDPRPDMDGRPTQILLQATFGAVRLEEGKVAQVLCFE